MWFESDGTLLLDPPSDKWNGNSSRWWAILACDTEILHFYQWLLQKSHGITLMRPAWGSHVSVVRREKPPSLGPWSIACGRIIRFEYENVIRDNGIHFWLAIRCEECLDLRAQLGLDREPELALHLTLGMIPPQCCSLGSNSNVKSTSSVALTS